MNAHARLMTTCELYYVHFLLFLLYVCKYSLYTANLPLPVHFTTVRPPTALCVAEEICLVRLFQADPRWSLLLGAEGDLCSDLLFGFISWVRSLLICLSCGTRSRTAPGINKHYSAGCSSVKYRRFQDDWLDV